MSLFRVCMFLVVLASAPSPADACQCRYRGPAANLRDAAAIVVGTVVSIDPKTHAHVIAVDGVWKGTPGKRRPRHRRLRVRHARCRHALGGVRGGHREHRLR